jgi:hypothetical protein
MAIGYSATLQVKPKSMTLKRDDISKLWSIVFKAIDENDKYPTIRLIIEGNKESVSAKKIDDLMIARWPSSINEIDLTAESNGKSIRIWLSRDGLIGVNRIHVSGVNVDWVNARVKELEDFISDHRNMHWFFHNWISVFLQIATLWIVILEIMIHDSNMSDDLARSISIPMILVIMCTYYGLGKLYPFTFINNEKQDFSKLMRTVMSFVIVACFTGLIGALIAKLV